MKLRGIEFGAVVGASGVQGFFGEGYPYHQWLHRCMPSAFSFDGMTFVAKTTTLTARPGNLPLREDRITPREFWPKCIRVDAFSGVALNAVGLSGPGAQALFEMGRWQQRTDNFGLSFMAVGRTPKERLEELEGYLDLFLRHMAHRRAHVFLQINFSCPNVGLKTDTLVNEVGAALDLASHLGIPLMPKFNVAMSVDVIVEIARHRYCDAICMSNTIPWGKLPERIDWQGIFGSTESPLAEFGGGGLSGAPLLPVVIDWVRRAHQKGISKPIVAGGGILGPRDVERLVLDVSPDAVSIGSIVFLRPWRLAATIERARSMIK